MTTKKDLNGIWKFSERGKNNWKTAAVPGCVQMDLMAQGELPYPFYRMNENHFQDAASLNWDYKKEFTLTKEELAAGSRVSLVFEGLDTFCDIHLNGRHLGRSENMFVSHFYDVTNAVKQGHNILVARFDSPIKVIEKLARRSTLKLTAIFDPLRAYARKAQYSFGWDWGPRIVTTGIWRNVYLEFVDGGKLEHPFIRTEKIGDRCASLNISCEISHCLDWEGLEVAAAITFCGKEIAFFKAGVKQVRGGVGFIKKRVKIKDVHLWFPNGSGKPNLYKITFTLISKKKPVDTLTTSFGIRTIKLIQKADEEGRNFIFEINGVKIFCKGANWIPADSLLSRVGAADYRDWVALARDANMNMLRVWGGGIYEDHAFYNACDEMGVMVWQDFMYACAEYPDEQEWFQKLARQEATAVVKRLRNYASVVLWCGNNENNWALHSWWNKGGSKFYGNHVYKRILPGVCAQHDSSRPYWVSSPYGGKDPNCETQGDRHSWDVWINWKDYELYKKDKGRFISEFGFQALPNWKTVLSFTDQGDRSLLSQTMLCHNKVFQGEGSGKLVRFFVEFAGLPKDFRSAVYLSQFNQAEAVKTGVEHWRSRKFKTSGTLYWQFNDCWPSASWSSVDYYKRKKALWHYSKRFFANILPKLECADGKVHLSVINDFDRTKRAKILLKAYRFDGQKIWESSLETHLRRNGVTKVKSFATSEFVRHDLKSLVMKEMFSLPMPVPLNRELLEIVVFAEALVEGETYGNYLVFDRFRNLHIPKPQIKMNLHNKTLDVTADKPVFGFFVETENDVDVSDNCLNLEPSKLYRITFSGDPGKIETFNLADMVAKI